MKKLLLTAAALVALAAPAAADDLPRAYLGTWCAVDTGDETVLTPIKGAKHPVAKVGFDEPCSKDGGPMVIRRNGYDFLTDDGEMGEPCRFIGVRKGQLWPRWTKPQKNDWVPEVTLSVRCEEGPAIKVRLNWNKGDIVTMTRIEARRR